MPTWVANVFGWFKEQWPDMSNWILAALTVLLALIPTTIQNRENRIAWKIGIVALVLFVAITGSLAGRSSTEQLKSQVSSLYGQLQFAATKNDIGTLTAHIDAGFRDVVGAIKGLPQTTKSPKTTTPVKPSVNPPENPPPSLPTPAHVSFTQARGVSTNSEFPYALLVTIQSDQSVPVAFAIDCTGPVGDAKAFLVGQGVMMNVMFGRNGNAALVKIGFPALTPQAPLVVTILSKGDIRAVGIRAL